MIIIIIIKKKNEKKKDNIVNNCKKWKVLLMGPKRKLIEIFCLKRDKKCVDRRKKIEILLMGKGGKGGGENYFCLVKTQEILIIDQRDSSQSYLDRPPP